MTAEILGQAWNVINALIIPLIVAVYTLNRRESQAQHDSLRELLTNLGKQYEREHSEIHARLHSVESELHAFKLSAATNFMTGEDIKNLVGELRDVQRKLEACSTRMSELHIEWTREISKYKEECRNGRKQ
ncbi:MAG TPA: hypothetical protein DIC36_08650 [Gammaproteobacteria bacterium]|nr:hypothetical protein [Gammaproteobacteria bacterium]